MFASRQQPKAKTMNMYIASRTPQQLMLPLDETCFPESYHKGYETGLNWWANYIAGGPFVYTTGGKDSQQESEAKHAAWMQGFHAGLAQRFKNDPAFAAWWETHNHTMTHSYMVYPGCH